MEPDANAVTPMRVFRARWSARGMHVHVRLFEARPGVDSWAKNGDLVFDAVSWAAFRLLLVAAGIDVIADNEGR